MAGPLAGLRVLDLSRILAGPWATQNLADLGADVIKVERPKGGDDTRSWGPPFFDADGEPVSAYYMCANRGKHSVAIDMAAAEGQAFIKQLVAKSDILVENFKVDGLKKYGLDYASLAALNPGLIYCSITGFGQTGPYKNRPGYDLLIQGLGGLMSVTGEADHLPGGGPQRTGVAVADLFTGMYSAVAILGALHHRTKTGEGQHIDMSLLDTQVAMLANQGSNYLTSGNVPVRQGNSHPTIVPYQNFATKDGYMILAVGNDSQFTSFCKAVDMPGLAKDPRFTTNPQRVENREELVPIVAGIIVGRTTEEWVALLESNGVPGGPINDIEGVFADEHVAARGLQLSLARAEDGVEMPSVANPIRYSKTEIDYTNAPPILGGQTEDVLHRVLGLSGDDIAKVREKGVIG